MFRNILLSASLITLFAGCGLEPTSRWEVSLVEGTMPNTCFVNGTPPMPITTVTGVDTNVGPWEIYEGPEGKRYLIGAESNSKVVEGVKADSYTFQWSITVSNTQKAPIMFTTVDTTANTVDFQIAKDTLSGTWNVKTTHTCTGTSCMGTLPNCDVTGQIRGRRLDIDRDIKVY